VRNFPLLSPRSAFVLMLLSFRGISSLRGLVAAVGKVVALGKVTVGYTGVACASLRCRLVWKALNARRILTFQVHSKLLSKTYTTNLSYAMCLFFPSHKLWSFVVMTVVFKLSPPLSPHHRIASLIWCRNSCMIRGKGEEASVEYVQSFRYGHFQNTGAEADHVDQVFLCTVRLRDLQFILRFVPPFVV